MSNPTDVTAGTLIEETWGDAVVSRVVGIYSSLAAAEADGRTDIGAVVTLTDGTLWVKQSAAALDWDRFASAGNVGTLTDSMTIDDLIAFLKLTGTTSLGFEPFMTAYVHFEDGTQASHDWYVGINPGADVFEIVAGDKRFVRFWDSEFSAKTVDTISVHVPHVSFYDDEAETNLRYEIDSDGRHTWADEVGTVRMRLPSTVQAYHGRIMDETGAIFFELRDADDSGGSTLQGSPLRGIRTGTALPIDPDGNNGDIYLRTHATASSRALYVKVSGSWLEIADHA